MIGPEKDVSVSEQCRLLEVPRSSYYRPRGTVSPLNLAIMNRLDELYTADPTWGSRKMRDRLRLEGYPVNRKRVQRLMRVMGLEVIYPQTKLRLDRHPGAQVYPYLLRELPITKANQVWCADITCHPAFARLRVSGGRAGLVLEKGPVLEAFDHRRPALRHRCPRGGPAPLRGT